MGNALAKEAHGRPPDPPYYALHRSRGWYRDGIEIDGENKNKKNGF